MDSDTCQICDAALGVDELMNGMELCASIACLHAAEDEGMFADV